MRNLRNSNPPPTVLRQGCLRVAPRTSQEGISRSPSPSRRVSPVNLFLVRRRWLSNPQQSRSHRPDTGLTDSLFHPVSPRGRIAVRQPPLPEPIFRASVLAWQLDLGRDNACHVNRTIVNAFLDGGYGVEVLPDHRSAFVALRPDISTRRRPLLKPPSWKHEDTAPVMTQVCQMSSLVRFTVIKGMQR